MGYAGKKIGGREEVKHDWKITIVLKSGKEITGIFTSEHGNSGDVYEQIFSDMTEKENEGIQNQGKSKRSRSR